MPFRRREDFRVVGICSELFAMEIKTNTSCFVEADTVIRNTILDFGKNEPWLKHFRD